MKKICESCGMPMEKPEDFGGQNTNNKYCVYCTDNDGNLKSFEEKVNDFAQFIQRNNDISSEKARQLAIENLKKQPAWQNM